MRAAGWIMPEESSGCTYAGHNHTVIAVEYDINGNWKIRNHWGTRWAAGYVWIAANNTVGGACGVLSSPFIPNLLWLFSLLLFANEPNFGKISWSINTYDASLSCNLVFSAVHPQQVSREIVSLAGSQNFMHCFQTSSNIFRCWLLTELACSVLHDLDRLFSDRAELVQKVRIPQVYTSLDLPNQSVYFLLQTAKTPVQVVALGGFL